MSERLHRSALAALRQADALAAWVLLGWLGQRLGWSFASGVWPVVLWWGVRCGGGVFLERGPSPRVWLAGAAALLLSLTVLPAGGAALPILLTAAALWGGWSASLNAAAGATAPTLPGQAMGLMMGSLWLSGQWCLGPGWTGAQAVALHLGLMVGVPLLLSVLRGLGHEMPTGAAWQPPALLAAGALLMAWPGSTAWRLAGMVLLVLAWSLAAQGTAPARHGAIPLPAALGPLLLLAVGLASPTHGPESLQWAYGALGVLALLTALAEGLTDDPQTPPPLTWKDAS
ncbi:hypothetical protein [Hydrogenophaga sp. MI9]|uniref:hypothetical protein n=1 Tax=Hydrogenophaga sp. MI9 TaxID=3453719 RepID=UPI003EEF9520